MELKKTLFTLCILLTGVTVFAQTYEEGVKSGVKDADKLKEQTLVANPGVLTSGHYILERRYIDITKPGFVGDVLNPDQICSNKDMNCTISVKFVNVNADEVNIILWGKENVRNRRDYLWSRYNESDYWRGVYNGFYGKWFFSDYQ